MKQEIPNKSILTLKTSSKEFVRTMLDNLKTDKIILLPTKSLFHGTLNQTEFRLYRLKKITTFDYNITEFKGIIQPDNDFTIIRADFSLIWIYRYIIAIMTLIFMTINLFIFYADNFNWSTLFVFIAVELISIGSLWIQNKRKFKTDKEKYIRILESFFGRIELKKTRTEKE